jgi:hypothetical protein
VKLYEPTHVLKPFGDDIWIVDGGVAWMKLGIGLRIPFTTRMAVLRLPGGELVLWSPVEPTERLRAEVDSLGHVAHLVSPNRVHYVHLGAWKKLYPAATAWASPGVRERARSQGMPVTFDADLGDAAENPWKDAIDQVVFRGSRFLEEVVFLHRASRTLIVANLIENFETERLDSAMAITMRLLGATHPDGKANLNFRRTFLGRHNVARRSLARMMTAWAPEKVIVAHGRCYESDGGRELRRAFRWLDGGRAEASGGRPSAPSSANDPLGGVRPRPGTIASPR